MSRARRIRYSRRFFPEPVKELRTQLMAVIEGVTMFEQNGSERMQQDAVENQVKSSEDEGTEQEVKEPEQDESDALNDEAVHSSRPSMWFLWEKEESSHEMKVYQQRKHEALLKALGEVRAGQRRLSGRVISVWMYQRQEANRSVS